jgi:hypothetical protein
MQRLRPIRILAAAILALAPLAVRAAEPVFPPVTEAERAYREVPGEPNAPAVVLFKRGELELAGYGRLLGSYASHLRVAARVKILTEAGKRNREVAVAHGAGLRQNAVGAFHQTVAVHGRELAIERTAELRQRWLDPAAFPALKEIGLAEARTNKRRLRVSCGG